MEDRRSDADTGYEPAAKLGYIRDSDSPRRLAAAPSPARFAPSVFISCSVTSPASGTSVRLLIGVSGEIARAETILDGSRSPGEYHQICGRTIFAPALTARSTFPPIITTGCCDARTSRPIRRCP